MYIFSYPLYIIRKKYKGWIRNAFFRFIHCLEKIVLITNQKSILKSIAKKVATSNRDTYRIRCLYNSNTPLIFMLRQHRN